MSHPKDPNRRRLLYWFSAAAAALAAGRTSEAAEPGEVSSPVPRRALTGRDADGKSVVKSFDVTPNVVRIESNPGLTFYELYSIEGTPTLTGREPDPMLQKTKAFPGPGGTNFRGEKVPGMADHFDRSAPGMHTTDTVDYGVVVRGEMTLELDDGKIIYLRQGDCIVQNGTRHRWRNPGSEPCLMAFVSVGGKRSG